jgi:hypothetical protein
LTVLFDPHGCWLRFATTKDIVKIVHYLVFVRTQKTEAVGEPIQVSKYIFSIKKTMYYIIDS